MISNAHLEILWCNLLGMGQEIRNHFVLLDLSRRLYIGYESYFIGLPKGIVLSHVHSHVEFYLTVVMFIYVIAP